MRDKLARSKPVWVYRNLKHGRQAKPLYSVMQGGKVIRRTHQIMLAKVKFVVREAGRLKVLQSGRKNVHAFAVGYVTGSAMGTDRFGKLPVKITYHPQLKFWTDGGEVASAWAVILNQHGMTGAYLER